MIRALIILCTMLMTGCASEADRALLRDMPEGSKIRYRWIEDYGVTYRARFIKVPF